MTIVLFKDIPYIKNIKLFNLDKIELKENSKFYAGTYEKDKEIIQVVGEF